MKEARTLLTTAEMIMQRHSGWSEVKCDFCKNEPRKAQLLYCMRFYDNQTFLTLRVSPKWGRQTLPDRGMWLGRIYCTLSR
jgi:hypothetical protein